MFWDRKARQTLGYPTSIGLVRIGTQTASRWGGVHDPVSKLTVRTPLGKPFAGNNNGYAVV
eukprot:8539568-Alexandrium_andersonii.AAC.1